MNTRTPKLRRHHTGQWTVHWGGRDHYLGLDKKHAQQLYLDHIRRWSEWKAQRMTMRLLPPMQTILVDEMADRFVAAKLAELGKGAAYYYEKHLRRFRP